MTSDFPCPTCGKSTFASQRAMRIHHKEAHGESLQPTAECETCGDNFHVEEYRADEAKYCSYGCMGKARRKRETVTCEVCGDEFESRPSRKNPRFCSDDCNMQHQRQTWKGDGNPRWAGGNAVVTCDWCGEDYEVRPAKVEETRFCSFDCKGAWRSTNYSDEGNPNWGGGSVTVECEWCGEGYEVVPALVEITKCCSKECHDQYQTTVTGQDHSQWLGGHSLYTAVRAQLGDRGWWTIRSEVVADECLLCGQEQDLLVHHIIPLRSGGPNEPWNLMTLCSSCHGTVEAYTRKNIVDYHFLQSVDLS